MLGGDDDPDWTDDKGYSLRASIPHRKKKGGLTKRVVKRKVGLRAAKKAKKMKKRARKAVKRKMRR